MKRFLSVILFVFFFLPTEGHHIIGGEMYYTFIHKTQQGYQYKVVLKLYRGCEPEDKEHANLDPYVNFTIFNKDNLQFNTIATTPNIQLDQIEEKSNTTHDPCIHNPPQSCYRIGYYRTTITLPLNQEGYTIAYQRCCRDNTLKNVNTSFEVGATYFTNIPGSSSGIPGDNSPRFDNETAILLCSTGNVDYTFQATDLNKEDKLRYDFAPGYAGGNQSNLIPVPTSAPPFQHLQYVSDFSGKHPLGESITIDSTTGRIHGRAHLKPGTYDVTIRIRSFRKGKLINTHYHDFQFTVHNCKRDVVADIPPLLDECESKTFHFTNNSTSNKKYLWNFDDGTTSGEFEPTHTFQDTGTYHVWMKVNPASNCGDSMESIVKVYPEFKADFVVSNSCTQAPIQFSDKSTSTYGRVSSFQWDFGDSQSASNTSEEKNPQHTFTDGGEYTIRLTASNNLGCKQTVTKTTKLYGTPDLRVSPDTILCYKDPFDLHANSSRSGTYLWTTQYNINNIHISNPTVHPQKDTTYHLSFTDTHGCIAQDSVHLKVKHRLQVKAGVDTTICRGDPVNLHATSDENYAFSWYNSKNKLIQKGRNIHSNTSKDETYRVIAELGSCRASDQTQVQTIPYPEPKILPTDTTICYGDQIQLTASGGSIYHWHPSTHLKNPNQRNIFVTPDTTTIYTLTVRDTMGCPKPVDQQVKIGVIPPIKAFAGRDTIITIGKQFKLHAQGGNHYEWSPAQGLSNPFIPNPIVNRKTDITYRLKAMVHTCVGYDSIHIRYIKGPEIYVPSAFSPNGDGQNDIFRPIPVGMTKILYFKVYDRWGNLVYQTKDYMKGWGGEYKGQPAPQGAYVWMVKATDFNGKKITKKGSVLLIR